MGDNPFLGTIADFSLVMSFVTDRSKEIMMKTSIFAFLVLFFASAEAQVVFHEPTYLGAGCPQGTVSTVLSPDGTSLSVLFDEFRISLPDDGGVAAPSPIPGRGRAPRRRAGSSM